MIYAKLYKLIDTNWFVVFPNEINQDIDEAFAKSHCMEISDINRIDTSDFKVNQIVEGNIIRKNRKNYFEINIYNYSNAEFYIKNLMKSFSKVAITKEDYEIIEKIGTKENSITSRFSNGFSINYKYIIFGKLNKKKQVIYPQIKLK